MRHNINIIKVDGGYTLCAEGGVYPTEGRVRSTIEECQTDLHAMYNGHTWDGRQESELVYSIEIGG